MAISTATGFPTKDALGRLAAQLTCAICLERYTNPRTLACHHNFCEGCINDLQTIERGRSVVKCPTCRQPTHLGVKGAGALPTAFLINNLLEIDELLKKPLRKPHQKCPTHDKPQDIYCETCEELICFRCIMQTHQNHQVDLATDLLEKHKHQIEECLKPVKKRIHEITRTLKLFDTQEREIRDKGEAVKEEIDRSIQELMDGLQKSRNTLIQEVDTAVHQKLQLLSCQKIHVEAVLVQLKSCQEFVEEELRSKSQHQLQAAKKKLVQRIRDTHSKVKVSELQPAQRADTEFLKDLKVISSCKHVGVVQSTLNYSIPGLFVVDIPEHMIAGSRVEVSLTMPITPECLSYFLAPIHEVSESQLSLVIEGQFSIRIHPLAVGQCQLNIKMAGADIYGSPFAVHVLPSAEKRGQSLECLAKDLNGPCGIAVTDDKKHVVVAELNSHCVTLLSNTGEVVRRFGSHGRGHSKVTSPWGIAVSTENHIIVTDSGKLQKFTFTGSRVASIKFQGFGVAIHESGRIYSINKEDCKLNIFNPDLTPSHSFGNKGCFAKPCDVAIDTKGMVYVTDCSKQEVLKFTSEGQYLTSIGSGGEQPHKLGHPLGICIDSDDIMYVADSGKHQIMMFTTEGEFLGSFGSTKQQILQPRGVAVDKSGNLYMCDFNGEVLVTRVL